MRRGLLLAAALLMLLGAAPARAGVVDPAADLPSIAGHSRPAPRLVLPRASDLQWGGGSVLHSNRTWLVFWQPSGSGLGFDSGYFQAFETFLQRVAHDSHSPENVYGLTGQYYDAGGPAAYDSRYGGAILDTDPLPPQRCSEPLPPPLGQGPGWSTCVTDDQIQAELTRVASERHLPVTLGDVYFLVTPNGLGSCAGSYCALGGSPNGFCGYHSSTFDDLLYAVIPYNAVPGHCQSDAPRPNGGTADPSLSTLSHEHNEVITDPLLGSAWTAGGGNENGDLCLDQVANPPSPVGGSGDSAYDQVIDGGHYWLQLEWSNEEGGCAARDESDPLSLSLPSRPVARKRISLTAHGRDPDGRITGYLWSLGDGGSARGTTVRHMYRRAGSYLVKVRSTDSAGNWSFAQRSITVRRAPVLRRHRRTVQRRPRTR